MFHDRMLFKAFSKNQNILNFFLLENQIFNRMYNSIKSHTNYFVSIICKKGGTILSPKGETQSSKFFSNAFLTNMLNMVSKHLFNRDTEEMCIFIYSNTQTLLLNNKLSTNSYGIVLSQNKQLVVTIVKVNLRKINYFDI